MSHCTAPVIFNKVEAHTGNFGNELADHIAKQGAVRGELWRPSFSCVPGIQFLPVHSDCSLVEGDLRAYLKLQSQFRTSVAWQYHRHVQCNVPYFDSVDWDSTILNLHHGNLPGSLLTSVSMCSDQAYHVKALHGMLPTATRLLLTCPDLYHDNLCPCCLYLPETAGHLWQCAHSQVALGEIEREGTQLFWDLAAEAGLGPGLSRSANIFPGPYTIVEAVQGIIPLEWVTALHTSGLAQAKARSVALKVGKYMVSTAHKEIWQPHCDAQVIHECSLLVTQKAKTSGRIHVDYPCHLLDPRHRLHI